MSPLSRWEKIRRRFLRRAPKYQPSFTKFAQGNGLHFGNSLDVRIVGAEVVTGRVFDFKTRRTYQIDQSHANDEDKDAETINFTMKSRSHPDTQKPNYFLPPGDYVLLVWWWDDDIMRGGTYKDKFVIV